MGCEGKGFRGDEGKGVYLTTTSCYTLSSSFPLSLRQKVREPLEFIPACVCVCGCVWLCVREEAYEKTSQIGKVALEASFGPDPRVWLCGSAVIQEEKRRNGASRARLREKRKGEEESKEITFSSLFRSLSLFHSLPSLVCVCVC